MPTVANRRSGSIGSRVAVDSAAGPGVPGGGSGIHGDTAARNAASSGFTWSPASVGGGDSPAGLGGGALKGVPRSFLPSASISGLNDVSSSRPGWESSVALPVAVCAIAPLSKGVRGKGASVQSKLAPSQGLQRNCRRCLRMASSYGGATPKAYTHPPVAWRPRCGADIFVLSVVRRPRHGAGLFIPSVAW